MRKKKELKRVRLLLKVIIDMERLMRQNIGKKEMVLIS
jgi:hypothetical protein